MKASLKLTSLVIILMAILAVAPNFVMLTKATETNAIQNHDFEDDTDWEARYSSLQGSFAQVQDSTTKHGGDYSGLTTTANPKQEYCSASLYQDLSVPLLEVTSFSYWLTKGESASDGYYTGKASISVTGGRYLHYYHGFDGSSPPTDTTNHKYINAGNPRRPNIWKLVSRNLFSDLVNEFGTSILCESLTGIELFSKGTKNLYTGDKYGQVVNWDDITLSQRTFQTDPDVENDYNLVRYDYPWGGHPVWYNVTARVEGYRSGAHSPYFATMHNVELTQGHEGIDDFRFHVENMTFWGLDSEGQIVYRTTYVPSGGLMEYSNTTYFADEVYSAYTYINVTIVDVPADPDYESQLTAQISSLP